MSRKTSVVFLILLILAAVLLGLVLVNKGDGPVEGVIISDRAIEAVQDYENVKTSPKDGVYLVLSNEFNKFREKVKTDIPAGKELFAAIHFVECPKGMQFTVRWIYGTEIVKEETKKLLTNQKGVISYSLEGNRVQSGSYKLELYSGGRKLQVFEFTVK